MTDCSVAGCGRKADARTLCKTHYTRWRRHGHPEHPSAGDKMRRELKKAAEYKGDNCLVWPLYRDQTGRGYAFSNGKRTFASRIVCEMVNGPPPSAAMVAAHSCGKGHLGCVNPRHLRWATIKENIADRHIHDTNLRGLRNPNCKLTPEQVATVRGLIGTASQKEIARMFGISQSLVSLIKNNLVWA